MRAILKTWFRCTLILFPLSAAAHETLPKDWCLDESHLPVVAEEFTLDEDALMDRVWAFEETHDHSKKPPRPGVFDPRCGIVDLWSWADVIAAGYCAEAVEGAIAMPIVLGPQSFLDKEHHRDYRLSEGLRGVCVVCKKAD